MKLALYQIEDEGDVVNNIEKARKAIISTEADFFVLPEFFSIPGGDFRKHYTIETALHETAEPALKMLKEASLEFPGYVIGGSILEKDEEKYYNTCFVIRNGEEIASYRKIHITQEEIDLGISQGEETVTFQTKCGKVGILICADCIYEKTTDKVASESDIVFLPISLTDPNRPKVEGHPVLTRIAQKHGVTVVKVSRLGTFGGRKLVAKSAIVSPLGVLYEAGDKEELTVLELEEKEIKS